MINGTIRTSSGTITTGSNNTIPYSSSDFIYLSQPQLQAIGKMTLGVVLARGGSKGVPGKNIADLCGKPVLEYTLDAANNSKYLNDIVVSSDDQRTLQIARKNGTIPLWRPTALAQDETPTLPALQHAVLTLEGLLGVQFDYIVELRATSPLKTTKDIDNVIELLVNSDAEAVIGVTQVQEYHPSRIKFLHNGYIRDFMDEPGNGRRQDLKPEAYVRNGSIYAFRRETILGDNPKVFGHDKALGYIMPRERSINIEEPLDLKICELILRGG